MNSTSSILQGSTQYSFLIIGYGDEQQGDDAVGLLVARAVADWRLASVKSLAVQQLTPDQTTNIARSNYVIFVGAGGRSCAQNTQITPIVVDALEPAATPIDIHSNTPLALLKQAQRTYGRHPQAWLLKVPTECSNAGAQISVTARQGCDRTLRTIAQFFTTYRQPQLFAPELCVQSA